MDALKDGYDQSSNKSKDFFAGPKTVRQIICIMTMRHIRGATFGISQVTGY
ncbi:MAG: hypothetical protein IPJ13_01615 [Saprospiraceae bacterium]|nr:hypothetical protein [Saprospiraceae bacterium]